MRLPFAHLLDLPPDMAVDFANPPGAEALAAADSVSWRIFANPVTLFIGGVAAVILELAEPHVRAGVWDHSSFRSDPLTRLRRTGAAAMITVYAPRAEAEAMIARVVALHEKVRGTLGDGRIYQANDPRLLTWVQATATFGFMEAYHRFAARLTEAERSAVFAEGQPAAELFGATAAPSSLGEWESLLKRTLPDLEQSLALHEFLAIMRRSNILPKALRPIQRLLVKAALTIVPQTVREQVGIATVRLRRQERLAITAVARAAEWLELPASPAVQARRRVQV